MNRPAKFVKFEWKVATKLAQSENVCEFFIFNFTRILYRVVRFDFSGFSIGDAKFRGWKIYTKFMRFLHNLAVKIEFWTHEKLKIFAFIGNYENYRCSNFSCRDWKIHHRNQSRFSRSSSSLSEVNGSLADAEHNGLFGVSSLSTNSDDFGTHFVPHPRPRIPFSTLLHSNNIKRIESTQKVRFAWSAARLRNIQTANFPSFFHFSVSPLSTTPTTFRKIFILLAPRLHVQSRGAWTYLSRFSTHPTRETRVLWVVRVDCTISGFAIYNQGSISTTSIQSTHFKWKFIALLLQVVEYSCYPPIFFLGKYLNCV